MRWPCRRVLRHPIFCLDPRGQSRAGDWLLPELYIRDELKSGELVSVLNDWTQPFAGLRLYYPGHRHVPPGLRALVAMIRERRIIPVSLVQSVSCVQRAGAMREVMPKRFRR